MPAKRKKCLYDPASSDPFPISRSAAEAWLSCPKCFWLHKRLGIRQPGPPAMMLNRAVDELLKKEFDQNRVSGTPHPLMAENGIDAVPFNHPELATWRSNFKGVKLFHKPTNFMLGGAVDDLWMASDGELFVADYKGTASAKDTPMTLDTIYRQGYKRQLEFYVYLLRGNGFRVSSRSFIVYAVGQMNAASLNGNLRFDLQLIEHLANIDWIEPTLANIKTTLMLDSPPPPALDCELCNYVKATQEWLKP